MLNSEFYIPLKWVFIALYVSTLRSLKLVVKMLFKANLLNYKQFSNRINILDQSKSFHKIKMLKILKFKSTLTSQ